MAKITRKSALVFGSTSSASQIAKFGSFAAGSPVYSTDPAVIQALGSWLSGWFTAVSASNSPTIEDMNAVCYVMAYQIAYALQTGVAEYDAGTTYYKGSVANDGTGNIYVSITDTNLNQGLASTANWQPMLKLCNSGFVMNVATPTLAANATITLPALPAFNASLQMDTSGNITTVLRGAASTAVLGGIAISTACGIFQTTSTTYTDVTNLTVTLTTAGRPVMLSLIADGSHAAYWGPASGTAAQYAQFGYHRGASAIGEYLTQSAPNTTLLSVAAPSFVDIIAAGTWTYKVRLQSSNVGATVGMNFYKLVAYEL